MPNILPENYESPEATERRFKVMTTGEEGTAIGPNEDRTDIFRKVSFGAHLNVILVDLLDDETGEVRTFLLDRLEEIKAKP